jgi:hypothetical protein
MVTGCNPPLRPVISDRHYLLRPSRSLAASNANLSLSSHDNPDKEAHSLTYRLPTSRESSRVFLINLNGNPDYSLLVTEGGIIRS